MPPPSFILTSPSLPPLLNAFKKSDAYNNVFKERLLEIASDAEDIFTVTPKKSIRINTLKAEK